MSDNLQDIAEEIRQLFKDWSGKLRVCASFAHNETTTLHFYHTGRDKQIRRYKMVISKVNTEEEKCK